MHCGRRLLPPEPGRPADPCLRVHSVDALYLAAPGGTCIQLGNAEGISVAGKTKRGTVGSGQGPSSRLRQESGAHRRIHRRRTHQRRRDRCRTRACHAPRSAKPSFGWRPRGLLRLYPQRGALVVPVSPAEVRAVMEARLLMEKFAADKIVERGPEVRAASLRTAVRRNGPSTRRQRNLRHPRIPGL